MRNVSISQMRFFVSYQRHHEHLSVSSDRQVIDTGIDQGDVVEVCEVRRSVANAAFRFQVLRIHSRLTIFEGAALDISSHCAHEVEGVSYCFERERTSGERPGAAAPSHAGFPVPASYDNQAWCQLINVEAATHHRAVAVSLARSSGSS